MTDAEISHAELWCQVTAMPKAAEVGNIPEEAMSRVQLLEIRTDVRRFDECDQTCINTICNMLFRTIEHI